MTHKGLVGMELKALKNICVCEENITSAVIMIFLMEKMERLENKGGGKSVSETYLIVAVMCGICHDIA